MELSKKTKNKPIAERNDEHVPEKLIPVEEAKEKALSHAGIEKREEAYFTKTKLNQEKGTVYFEIKFIYKNTEYEYEINAKNGEILESSLEKKEISSEVTDANIEESFISLEKAKENALAHAKISSTEATFANCELDEEDGIYVYEIEFYTKEKSFEYEINAKDGSVIEYSCETFFDSQKNNVDSNVPQENKPEHDVPPPHPDDDNEHPAFPPYNAEDAKNVAFKDAGIIAPEHPHKIESDIDEDGHKFEIEFSTEKGDFKYEINAETGEISEKEFKPFPQKAPHDKPISIDEAKKKALEALSLSEKDVIFTKAKLEKEDRVSEYDIEFIYQGKEYEFSINAITGEIHEMDID